MPSSQWTFDRFRLDPGYTCLWCDAKAIALSPKSFAVLHYLVTHPDRLVTKDELLDAVWPETAITDAVVRVAIGALRKVLGDTVRTPRFIATVPRRGYRFLAPVAEHPGAVPGPVELAPFAAPQVPTVGLLRIPAPHVPQYGDVLLAAAGRGRFGASERLMGGDRCQRRRHLTTSQLVKQHKNLFERLDIQDTQTLYTVAFVHSTQLEYQCYRWHCETILAIRLND